MEQTFSQSPKVMRKAWVYPKDFDRMFGRDTDDVEASLREIFHTDRVHDIDTLEVA